VRIHNEYFYYRVLIHNVQDDRMTLQLKMKHALRKNSSEFGRTDLDKSSADKAIDLRVGLQTAFDGF